MKRKHQLKSMLALILAFVMCLTEIPTTVLATEAGGTVTTYGQVISVDEITAGGSFVLAVQTDKGYFALDANALSGKTAGTPVTVADGIVSAGAPTWTLAPCGAGVSLTNGTQYLAYTSSTNYSAATDPYEWTVTQSETGGFHFVAAATATASTVRGILYQKGTVNKFGAYATSNYTNSTYAPEILVFKAGTTPDVGGGGTTPTPPETGEGETTPTPPETGEGGTGETTPLTLITIAEAKAKADTANPVMVKGTVTFIDGKNVYMQDATGGIDLFFNAKVTSIAPGSVVTATGVYKMFNGLAELTGVVESDCVVEAGDGSVPEATVHTLAEIIADNNGAKNLQSTRVRVENAVIGAVNTSDNTTLTQTIDGVTSTLNIYKCPALREVSEGDVVTVEAVVGAYNAAQLRVVSAQDVTVVQKACAPVVAAPKAGEVETGTEVTLTTATEGAVIKYNTDGSTNYVDYTAPIVITEAATISAYAVKDGLNDSVVTSFAYTIAAGTEEKPDDGTLKSGTYVIWAPAYNKALSSVYGGYYNNGVNVTLTDGLLSGYTNAEIWTVTRNEDDTYDISYGGKNLAMADSNSSMPLGEKNDKWVLEDAGDGKYYVKNTGRNSYIEWYKDKAYWSAYYKIAAGSEGMFALTFTPAEKGYDTDASVTETIAQFGGGGPYDDTINATTVYGDKYVAGDQKDTDAAFTVVAKGVAAKPFQKTSTNTGGVNYYMGGESIGAKPGDYMQFALDTAGFGGMSLSFRLRATGAAPGSFALQYSTDNGATFKDFTTGEYSYAYTTYPGGVPTEATGSGKITDGTAYTSKASGQYVSFKFDVPKGAENAKNLLVRLVAGTTRADGKSGSVSGNIRVEPVVLTGSPIVDDSITGYVTVSPDGADEDQVPGTALTMTTATEGAVISYRFVDTDGNGAWQTYDAAAPAVLPAALPAVLEVKASAAGKADSITRMFTYAAGSVAPVKMTPNGGGIYVEGTSTEVTLSCQTEGASIYYRCDKKGEFAPYTEALVLEKGFGEKVVEAYAVKEGFKDSAIVTRTFTERSSDTYNLYFGQLHSHTNYSDGAGSASDAYEHASKVKNLDFLAVTDHSNSFDNAGEASIADGSMSTEWVEGHNLAKQYTTEDFVGLFGYEMTWSNGLGHMNTFNSPGFQSRTQAAYSTYATALQNYYAALKTQTESISQFNHPGTTFGDFSDFAYYDSQIDELITIIEVGNGEGAVGSSGYFPSYEYYTRALDKGWHVAPTNNQDNHKGLWGDANTGRSVVVTDSLSEADIYDAMRNYRVYATEDNDLSIIYTLNDNIMGTILDKNDVGENVTLNVELKDPTDSAIGKVEVIVNGGLSIASEKVTTGSKTVSFNVPSKYSYYYIRVTEPDGDIAVTAPVWVGEVEAVGISGLSTTASLPVQNQALDLTLDLYNNEKKDLVLESIEFTINDKVIHTADLTDLAKVGKMSTASYTFRYTHDGLGATNIYATVKANLDGVEKVYKEVLKLNYVAPAMVTRVIVDGTHCNDYVTGYYGGNMGNFTTIAAGRMVEVTVVKDKITDEMLKDCGLLVISAPARTSGTANAGDYVAKPFEDSFIQMVSSYVKNGGNVAVCGLADYQDTKAASADNHAAKQLNTLLNGIGSTLRINDDEAMDDEKNGGQAYRLYPETFNADSRWTAGIVNGQTYSQYSGCTVNVTDAAANDTVKAGEWIVKGFDTTYSIDSDKDGSGGVAKGDAVFMAAQDTVYGGTIFAAGGVFLSDFEVKAELDNIWDLPYANRTIAETILGAISKQLPLSTIAEMRAGEFDDVFRIQGYATAGRVEGNAFFDAMYIQDETAGITVFPIAEDGLKIGTKMEIVGYLDQYQGDREIQVMSYKILDEEPYVYAPQKMTAKEAMDYEKSGGKLVSVAGKVVDVLLSADGTGVSQFWIDDGSGTKANVFIDGYILSGTTGKNELASIVKKGAEISAVGLVYAHPEGVSDVPVTCLRVRDCDEITKAAQGGNEDGNHNGGNTDNGNENGGNNNNGGSDNNGGNDNSGGNVWGSVVTNPQKPVETPKNNGKTNTNKNKKPSGTKKDDNASKEKKDKIVVKENGDWKQVKKAFDEIADGGEICITLEKDTVVSGDVIAAMRGKDVSLIITLENGVTWTIYGKDVIEKEIGDIDLQVALDTDGIPAELEADIAGENSSIQISLKHNGEFGFRAYMTVEVGAEYAGDKATLYYYNEESGELEQMCDEVVAEDGTVKFMFSHASEYLLVMEPALAATVGVDTAAPEAGDGNVPNEVEAEKTSGNMFLIIILLLVAAAGIVAAVIFHGRNKKNQIG